MSLFGRRPLMTALTVCFAAMFAAAFLPHGGRLAIAAATVVLAVIGCAAVYFFNVKRICSIPSAAFICLTSSLMLFFMLVSYGFFDVYAHTYVKRSDEHSVGNITAAITEVRYESEDLSIYRIKLKNLDGEERIGDGLMTCDDGAVGYSVGCMINFDGEFVPLSSVYGKYEVSEKSLLADNIIFACKSVGKISVIGEDNGPAVHFSKLRSELSSRLSLVLDGETAGFARAIILADRSGLGRITRNFSVIGVSHLLALSGLHLSIIIGGLSIILSALSVPKIPKVFLEVSFVVYFMYLTGFPYSVVRAGLMLIIFKLSQLIIRDHDSVTILFSAAGLILLANPHALFDVGFMLSFSATLGVVVMSSVSGVWLADVLGFDRFKPHMKILCGLFQALAVSLGASVFTLPIQWISFGKTSLLSVPATVILSIFIELSLWMLILLFALMFFGLSDFYAAPAAFLHIFRSLSEQISDKMAAVAHPVSLNYPFTLPIILLTLTWLAVMSVRKVKNRLLTLIPIAAAVLTFGICISAYNMYHADDIRILYSYDKSNETVVVISENRSMIIDFSSGSSNLMRKAVGDLGDRCFAEADTYLLSHYHAGHSKALKTLLENTSVERVYLPDPQTEDEKYIFDDISELCRKYSAEVCLIPENRTLSFGKAEIRLFYEGEDESSCPVSAGILCGDFSLLYLESDPDKIENMKQTPDGYDAIIVGTHSRRETLREDFAGHADAVYYGGTEVSEGYASNASPTENGLEFILKP